MTDKNQNKSTGADSAVEDLFAEYKLYMTHEKMRYNTAMYQGGVFGNQLPSNDPEYSFDDRYFEKSPLKHSSYLKRMRSLRERVQFYTEAGFLPERYCEEYPLPFGNQDIRCYAQVEFGEGFKRISLDTGQVFFVYENMGVHIFNLHDELPEIFLADNSFLQVADTPFYDLFINKGIVPETIEKTYRLCSLYDTVGNSGGVFSLSYEVSDSGNVLESISLEIKLYRQDGTEIHRPSDANKAKE